MIPPLASFWVDFTFFFCPPALFSPGNRRLSPRRFIGQLSYILHMCVDVWVCAALFRSRSKCAREEWQDLPVLASYIIINLLHLDAIIGQLNDNFIQYCTSFFSILIFISPLFKSRGDHWGQALIYNDVESTAEQRDKWQQKPNIAKNGYI